MCNDVPVFMNVAEHLNRGAVSSSPALVVCCLFIFVFQTIYNAVSCVYGPLSPFFPFEIRASLDVTGSGGSGLCCGLGAT